MRSSINDSQLTIATVALLHGSSLAVATAVAVSLLLLLLLLLGAIGVVLAVAPLVFPQALVLKESQSG